MQNCVYNEGGIQVHEHAKIFIVTYNRDWNLASSLERFYTLMHLCRLPMGEQIHEAVSQSEARHNVALLSSVNSD